MFQVIYGPNRVCCFCFFFSRFFVENLAKIGEKRYGLTVVCAQFCNRRCRRPAKSSTNARSYKCVFVHKYAGGCVCACVCECDTHIATTGERTAIWSTQRQMTTHLFSQAGEGGEAEDHTIYITVGPNKYRIQAINRPPTHTHTLTQFVFFFCCFALFHNLGHTSFITLKILLWGVHFTIKGNTKTPHTHTLRPPTIFDTLFLYIARHSVGALGVYVWAFCYTYPRHDIIFATNPRHYPTSV